jgi:glucose/arabinose dehydrogenase
MAHRGGIGMRAIALCLAGLFAALALPAVAEPPGLDQLPGQHFEISADDLPEPSATPIQYVANSPRKVERGENVPIVPEGFTVTLFAEGLPHPRRIAVLPDGTVLVVQQNNGLIIGLADEDGDGIAELGGISGQNFSQPFGLVLVPAGPFAGDLLMSDPALIYRLPVATGGKITPLTAPTAFGAPQGHITRALALEPATGAIFVAVGSLQNLAEEPEVKATIQRFEPDGSGQTTFARGLRNATGLGFEPSTGDLYAVVMERDAMGDALVPDFFAKVSEGDDFGWPYQYAGGIVQPEFSDGSEKRAAAKLPEVMFEAHSAPMDLIFLPDTWPEDYRGDAIVALKGSSNREMPTGYKLVRIAFADGAPVGGYDNFATGFWLSGTSPAEVWGRPAALALTADGGLLVADDFGGTLWKIMPPRP